MNAMVCWQANTVESLDFVAAHFSWVCLSFTNNHPPRIKKNKSYNVIILFVGIRDYTKLHITCKF